MINIVFVETNCKKNGPIKQTLNIIRYMDRSLFSPSLITIWPEEEGNSMLDEYKQLQVPVYCCCLGKAESVIKGKGEVTKILNRIKPDIVQGVGMPPYRMTLGYKETIHFITLRNYCYEDYPDQYAKGIGNVMAYMDIRLIRKQMKKVEPFVTCSESLTKIYRERENLEIPFVRNGVDVSEYPMRNIENTNNIRRKLSLPVNKTIFVYSGGLIDRKNQKEAIEGFIKMNRCKDAVLLLLGDGNNRNDLENKYGNFDNVIFKGKVSNVCEYLHASDIYVSTSKSEGMPNGVLEAMASGLPVVLSDIPQHLEVLEINDSYGERYKLGDLNSFVQAVNKVANKDLSRMSVEARRVAVEYFDASKMSYKYQEIYKNLIMGR